jgi:hypothetical protein
MNKKYQICLLVCIILGFAGLQLVGQDVHKKKIFSTKELELYNISVFKQRNGQEYYKIKDVSYENNQHPLITDLILSFNKSKDVKATDDTGKYSLNYVSYKKVSGKGEIGRGAALFYKQDHVVKVQAKKKLWLCNSTDLGSFSIEMRIHPLTVQNDSTIISRLGYSSGKRNGFEIKIKNQRLVSRFYGVFHNETGKSRDYVLDRGPRLKKNTWYHYVVSYDRISGKLSHYINEKEVQAFYVTESKEPYNGIMYPRFNKNDVPLLVIAGDYYGYLDEIRISFRKYQDLKYLADIAAQHYRELQLNGRVPINKEGVITSPVYEFENTGTMITNFSWQDALEKNTFVWMELRTADVKFDKEEQHIKWYRIKNKQRNIFLKKINDRYLRGKYYQWRAHLVPSPDGRRSPSISKIKINYEIDPSPIRPIMLHMRKIGNNKITISWKKNVDHDMGGYKVYYGVRSRQYEGVIKFYKGQRITNLINPGNYITLTIDKSIIEENYRIDKSGMLDYPLIKNSVLYFFAVSAYDSYRMDSIFNHESGYSDEISARPFAGSEITD